VSEGPIAISMKGVGKSYQMGSTTVHALSNIDLEIRRGEFVVILGPSGCGKSTLLNLVGGLDAPSSGELVILGENLTTANDDFRTRYRRESVGFVFQFFNLIPTLTAWENVQLAAELVASPRIVSQVLAETGLADRGSHFPSELSGGEQQRVAIARGIVKNPPILLCDEPTGELDFETGRKVLVLLHQVGHEQNQTILLVTHNSALAAIADRVIRMQSGRIVSDEVNLCHQDPATLEW